MKTNQKGFASFTLVLIGFTIIIGAWFVYTNYYNSDRPTDISNAPKTKSQPIVAKKTDARTDDVSGWQTYHSEKYGFEIKYPNGWDISFSSGSALARIYTKEDVALEDECKAREAGLIKSGVNFGPTGCRVGIFIGILDKQELEKQYSLSEYGMVAGGSYQIFQLNRDYLAPDFAAAIQIRNDTNYIVFESFGDKTGTLSSMLPTFKFIEKQSNPSGAIEPKKLLGQFSSSAMFGGKKYDFSNLRQCSGDAAMDCQAAELKKLGAGNDAVDFYRQSGWGVMSNYIGYSSYALVDVFSPLAANSNHQYSFLSGKNLWYLMDTDFSKITGNDRLAKEFSSGKEISFSNGEFVGLNKKSEIVFTFDVTTGCRSCQIGYRAVIGYKMDLTGPRVAASLLGFCAESKMAGNKYPECSSDSLLGL